MIFLERAMMSKVCRQDSAQLLFRGCATAMWTNFATHCSKNTRRPWCPAAFSNHPTTFESECAAIRHCSRVELKDSAKPWTNWRDKKEPRARGQPAPHVNPC